MPKNLQAPIHLPSGRIVRIHERAARAAAATSKKTNTKNPCLHHLDVLQTPGVLFDEQNAPLDPLELDLRDAHVLRAFLAKHTIVHEDVASFTCSNCGAPFNVAPSTLLETAPFLDGELNDPELDAPFDFQHKHRVPAVRVGTTIARSVRLAPRSVGEALPLWRASHHNTLTITPSIVAAMGIVAIGDERRASRIADALAAASPKAWTAIVDLFHDAHYPPRLVAIHRCAQCGAREDLDVPQDRELPRESLVEPLKHKTRGDFPEPDAFENLVRDAADAIYTKRRVRNIDLIIDTDVPACDDGGEPLLGCYTPGSTDPNADLIPARPEIRVFYKTFLAEHRADPTFDVEREIYETIDHEVIHHLNHLAGHDPIDDAEHDAIDVERARLVGRRESARRAVRSLTSDLLGFLRLTWPFLLLLALATALLHR